MIKTGFFQIVLLSAFASTALAAAPASSDPVPARGGTLPSGQNSDQVSWQHFVDLLTPVSKTQVKFETWASDQDIYTDNPHWPSGKGPVAKKLQRSALERAKAPHALIVTTPGPDTQPCVAVADAPAGNFPVSGSNPPPKPLALSSPQPCFAEEVRRNKPSYDYIVSNHLNTQAGLAQAYNKQLHISLPADSVEVKADWLPLSTLVDWLAANQVTMSLDQVKQQYYTANSGGVTYALVSLHMSSKEIPNWVWATLEHKDNPGRCDTMGCYDSFGAAKPAIAPVTTPNTQYGRCVKTPALEQMFKVKGLAAVWNNYCLKSSQIDFVTQSGAKTMLGDSFTERVSAGVPINASSCISCHASAAVKKDGSPFTDLLSTNPMGNVTLPPDVAEADFIWGILFAPEK